MDTPPSYSFCLARWPKEEKDIRAVREQVFIEELSIPPELEWDDRDEACYHVIAYDEKSRPIATGRVDTDGHIGRMAVLPPWRGRTVGGAVLSYLMHIAERLDMDYVWVHAQESAIPFYQKNGFSTAGDRFTEAGIPHQKLVRLILRKDIALQ